MKILIADEQGLIRAGIRMTLEAAEDFLVVGEVARGEEVLVAIGRLLPEVVLLDLGLPGLGGLAGLIRIRRRFPDVKVVICSMSDEPDEIQTAFKCGACGYILKRISRVDLPSAIRQAVEGTAYHALGLPGLDEATFARSAGLTMREFEIVKAVAHGSSNKAIAAELWLTVQTVKFHLTSIYRKLGVTNRTEAARWAYEKGLADPLRVARTLVGSSLGLLA